MINFKVTKNGREVVPSLYTWDEETKTFSSTVNGLVLNFSNANGVIFDIGSDCTIIAGDCCTFDASGNCNFSTGDECVFATNHSCNFSTGDECVFVTDHSCNFSTGDNCTFDVNHSCRFVTGKNCVIVRRDIFDVILFNEKPKPIKLNGYSILGFTYEYIMNIDGKDIKLSEESYNEIKRQLNQ